VLVLRVVLTGGLQARSRRRLQEFEESSVGQDRDQRGDQSRIVKFARDQAGIQRNLREDEGKLANLRKTDADALRSIPGITEAARNGAPNQKLAENNERDQQCN